MPVFVKQQLLTELTDKTDLIAAGVPVFQRLEANQLIAHPFEGKWSIAEIFEHLNIVNGLYIKSILKRMSAAPEVNKPTFTSGWLGEWACSQMKPNADGTIRKMKTPGKLEPTLSDVAEPHEALQVFLQQQDSLHDIFQYAAKKDLEKIRIPLAVTTIITLRLGDALRFIVAHTERHMLQAHKVFTALEQHT